MPSLQDIEQFKSDLNAVGREEEILAERGLTIEDVSPPEAGLSDDLSQLLELDTFEAKETAEQAAEPGEAAAPETALPDEGPFPPEEPLEGPFPPEEPREEPAVPFEAPVIAPPEEEPAAPPADIDMQGLGDVEIFDEAFAADKTVGAGAEEFDIEDIFAGLEETPPDEQPEEREPPAEEEFEGISEEEYAGLTEAMGIEAEETEEEPGAERSDDFSDVDFELPEFGEEEAGRGEAAAVEEPGEEAAGEELADIDFGPEAGPAEEPPASPGEQAAGECEFPEELGAELTAEEPVEGPEEPAEAAAGEEEGAPDEFAFDDEVDEFELPAEQESAAAAGAEEAEKTGEPAKVGEDDFDLDDFSLGDLSEQFGVKEEEAEKPPTEEELNPALAVSDKLPGSEDILNLTDDQFASLQRTLASLPRNLRIIVEESIGEEQLSGENLENLVDALVRGRSPRDIAGIAGRITGQRIVIPAAYEKRTGVEFEEEKGAVAYLFKYKVLPFARTAALVLVVLGLFSFLGYRFVYRPAKAVVLYNRGLTEIEEGSYIAGNEYFGEARELWESRRRFFQYAEAFAEQRRNDLAAEKYEELLAASRGFDRRGLIDYARLETYGRAAYAHSEELLEKILQIDKYIYDYEALLLSGDNYMEWALERPEKYENARLAFATLIQKYGERDELMFRMLEYFIRTDNLREVVTLKDYFQGIEKLDLNAEAYAETCAAIGVVFWSHRLNLLHQDASYFDVLERALYNGVLSGVSLDGMRFFYVNPLESDGVEKFNIGAAERQPWFNTACCPTNMARFLPSLGGYVYATDGADKIYVNLYAASQGKGALADGTVQIRQQTCYPWDGKVKLEIHASDQAAINFFLRIPGWSVGKPVPSNLYYFADSLEEKETKPVIHVNGKTMDQWASQNGYAVLNPIKNGDILELEFPMPIRRVAAHPNVKADAGKIALQRGPIVYCLEQADNPNSLENIRISTDCVLTEEFRNDLLGGVTVIQGKLGEKVSFKAIPYYAWNNRGAGRMKVWLETQ